MSRSVEGLALGPPGVYRAAVRDTVALRAVRMDVTGFVGVAARGPVDLPVPVENWSDYEWQFGGHSAGGPPPGLLGDSVRAFFAQGGRRAWVVRVSPLPRAPEPAALAATAAHSLSWGGERVVLRARNEGAWGQRLVAHVDFVAQHRFVSEPSGLQLPLTVSARVRAGDLLRIAPLQGGTGGELRWVEDVEHRGARSEGTPVAILDRDVASEPVQVEVVRASVTITDTSGDLPRQERFTDLALRVDRERFVMTVLAAESRLMIPEEPWPERLPPSGADLPAVRSAPVPGTGADRWSAITRESFIDLALEPDLLPVQGPDGLDGLEVHGLDLLSLQPEVMLMSAPDLLWRDWAQAAALDLGTSQDMRTGACSPSPVHLSVRQPPAKAAYLDGRTELDEVLARQTRFVALAERQRRFVALLDAPPGLSTTAAARWRSSFDSSYAAAYHPWLGVAHGAARDLRVVHLPPSACAAGIIAARERAAGIAAGPANVIAAGVVTAEPLGADELAELDALDINVFRPERDGFRLMAARTLATDPDYRQLSVRRLMTMLRLLLERQTQWLAFEPHTEQLRRQVGDLVTRLLRELDRMGTFAGSTEAESFFVRCDETINSAWSVGQGRLVAEIGVAPSVPLEFVILRLSRDIGGSIEVEV